MLLKDVDIQPQPKQSFSETWDRPLFAGKVTIHMEHTTADRNKAFKSTTSMRDKGKSNSRFLKKHQSSSESLPVEFTDAFFPY